jgi:hypothetical protein
MRGGGRRCGAAGRLRGQAFVWFALFLPAFVLGLLLLWDYLLTSRDVVMTAAALDLAVHAGVQAGGVDPDGRFVPDPAAGEGLVREVFGANDRVGAELVRVACGDGPPTCRAEARVWSRGLVLPRYGVVVGAEAVGEPGVRAGGD